MSGPVMTRRRFLTVSAALPVGGRVWAAEKAPSAEWRGTALGAQARITLAGLSQAEAAPTVATVEAEIARLENIFSLYRPGSALSALNRDGVLLAPPPELLEVLSHARQVWIASEGAFDPSIQPLWCARADADETSSPPVGLGLLSFDATAIRLMAPGMALTLNGIAQGFVTDRIVDLLAAEGLRDIAVNAGEVRVRGQRPGGGRWRVGIADAQGETAKELSITDRAIATSNAGALRFPGGGGHIIDARTGQAAQGSRTVSILHDRAVLADALSTAACCLTIGETQAMVGQFPGAVLAYRG